MNVQRSNSDHGTMGSVRETLAIALWFSLIGGVTEGALRTFLRGVPGFVYLNPPDILWVTPAFNAALFLTLAIALIVLFRVRGTAVPVRASAVLFAWVAAFGVLLTLGKMSQGAAFILSLGLAVQTARSLRGRDASMLSVVQRTLVPLLAVVALAGAVASRWDVWNERALLKQLPTDRADAPNLVLITLDTVRADHLSAYGYARATTPNIDRFAGGGVLLEHAIANSSWTLPSHAALFTGRLPHEHRADWLDPLDATYPTLAQILAGHGYVTAAFAANTAYVGPEWGLARGFTRFEVYGSSAADLVNRTLYGRKIALNVLPRFGYVDIPGRKDAATVNREFLHWLDATEHRPFFAFLNYLDTHDPYLPAHASGPTIAAPIARGDVINFQFQPHVFRRKPTVSGAEIQQEINGYDTCLASLDAEIGQLLQALTARGLDEKTLIVITSDHGEAFGNHDLFGHGNSLYIETLRVPLILRWPGHIPTGKRLEPTVSLHRLPATILDLFNLPAAFPGASLASLWSGDSHGEASDAVLSEVSPGRFSDGPPSYPTTHGRLRSVVTDRWHLLRSDSGSVQLFAWREDPTEAHDRASSPEGQSVIVELDRDAARRWPTTVSPEK